GLAGLDPNGTYRRPPSRLSGRHLGSGGDHPRNAQLLTAFVARRRDHLMRSALGHADPRRAAHTPRVRLPSRPWPRTKPENRKVNSALLNPLQATAVCGVACTAPVVPPGSLRDAASPIRVNPKHRHTIASGDRV